MQHNDLRQVECPCLEDLFFGGVTREPQSERFAYPLEVFPYVRICGMERRVAHRHLDRGVRDCLARAERGIGVQGRRLGFVEKASHGSRQGGEDKNDATHLIALLIHDSFPCREESDCA